MRRIRYSVAMSLDGYIAGPKGEYDWITIDPEKDFQAHFQQFDCALLGRKCYEMMRGLSGSGAVEGMKTYVVSTRLNPSECHGVAVISSPENFLPSLKSGPGKDIWLFGGSHLFRSLLNLGLVDTVEVSIIPVILGAGLPFVPPPADFTQLRLTRHQIYSKTGTVALEYAVNPSISQRRVRGRRKAKG